MISSEQLLIRKRTSTHIISQLHHQLREGIHTSCTKHSVITQNDAVSLLKEV